MDVSGLWRVHHLRNEALPGYDFWAPSRVIPAYDQRVPLLEFHLRRSTSTHDRNPILVILCWRWSWLF